MKFLDSGIAVVEGDTHIGRWIAEEGRIDHDLTVQYHIIPMLKPDWWVLDVGADVGSHTVKYASSAARVIAFEPNREEFNCLVWNCRNLKNVICLPVALGCPVTRAGHWKDMVTCENAGAGFLQKPNGLGEVPCIALDDLYLPRLDFLKIDVEGFEVEVLRGAKGTIEEYRPIILVEMNAGTLARYNYTYQDVFAFLNSYGYTWRSFAQDVDLMNTEQYDLLAVRHSKA